MKPASPTRPAAILCLQNGGTLEHAQQIAAHQSPRPPNCMIRIRDKISLDEVERTKF
jgi:hypothetical protein